ncbi:MAG TPA: hypothetical protein VD837_09635, partial [Terriglobales bacterium]|nr:hypothetical protein [Terriglobales bacterium]
FTTIDQDNPVGLISRKPQIRRPPAYYTTDWNSAHKSVRRLASLDPQIIGAGHGEPMSGPEAAWQLRQLAENWEMYAPDYGRYVREPARSDEQGLTHVPPPVADHVPIIAGAAALGALATIMGAMARRKKAA